MRTGELRELVPLPGTAEDFIQIGIEHRLKPITRALLFVGSDTDVFVRPDFYDVTKLPYAQAKDFDCSTTDITEYIVGSSCKTYGISLDPDSIAIDACIEGAAKRSPTLVYSAYGRQLHPSSSFSTIKLDHLYRYTYNKLERLKEERTDVYEKTTEITHCGIILDAVELHTELIY